MNLQFFGDSYDIIKKSFVGWLSEFGPWTVHPMFTHDVTAVEAELFARFLGADLISREILTQRTDRTSYFSGCLTAQNLFLDPDTGISLSNRRDRKSPNYVFGSELLHFVKARPERLTLVFDQSFSRAKPEQQALNIQSKLASLAADGAHGFAYVSHAPFLCFAADPSLAANALRSLQQKSHLPSRRFLADALPNSA